VRNATANVAACARDQRYFLIRLESCHVGFPVLRV
jgi:hypothetical protein